MSKKAKALKKLREALAKARKRGQIVKGWTMPADWRGK